MVCSRGASLTHQTNQMKVLRSIAATAAVVVCSAFNAPLPAAANQFRYCEPGTRCQEYSDCYINEVRQPCAYGSGGARLGAIIFDHGEFDVEWANNDFAYVTYGRNKEFRVKATVTREDGTHTVYQLSDGVTVKIPNVAGRYNPVGGLMPTHR